eukprot:TRINITY_DN22928_c0_g1_i2.p1 TRINITY_DN22928_c0_g1~~TRINITY_DN22928_c0_g1_i2.p1  ORF type:complete len:251 (+),score=56.89 TRINITY_DN22928_c0_g1_i2:79-831(+)
MVQVMLRHLQGRLMMCQNVRFSAAALGCSFHRSYSSPSKPSDKLIVSKSADIGKLGGAIAARLRAGGSATLCAMGPQAVYLALRAVARSAEYVSKEKPKEEVLLVAEQSSDATLASKSSPEGNVEMRLEAKMFPKPTSENHEEEAVLVAQKSNVGNTAAFLAARLSERSNAKGDANPSLRGMGATAASQALKAVAIARTYVAKAHPGEDVLVHPKIVKKDRPLQEGEEVAKKTLEFVLQCRRMKVVTTSA